jgi:thiamine-phosphate pyrophosphorylase
VKALEECRFYGILDLGYVKAADCAITAGEMIRGGVDIIQLRGKKQTVAELVDLARALHQITSKAGVPLIINDHAEVAKRVPVEGVHVGQDDDSVRKARKRAGRKIIVGKSTHSLQQARAARDEKPDYIGFGPLFATPTKPDYTPIGLTGIKPVQGEVMLPVFCIGGIKLDNLARIIEAGARRVVIVSGLLQAPDIARYAYNCKQMLSSVNQ